MATLSFEGTRAKIDAMDGVRETISRKLVENWYALHPDGNPPPTSENVLAEMEERINSPADASGNIPKYTTIGGETVPTAATIEEIGERTGRAVDEGTSAMGSSLLGKLWTAIRAFFDWMGNGFKGSFTESYAKITTGDINASFERQMADMAQDPEHKAFIEENNLVAVGKEKIAQAVRVKAGLEAAPEAFDLENVARPEAPKKLDVAEIESTQAPNATKEEKIGGYVTAAITAVKEQEPFKSAIANLDAAQKEKLAASENKILDNAADIALAPDAPKTGQEFAERVIKQSFKEEFGPDADKTPLPALMEKLDKGTKEQQQQAALIRALKGQLETVYPGIQKAAAGEVLSAEKTQELEQRQQEAQKEATAKSAQELARNMEKKIVSSVAQNVKDAATKKVALKTAEKGSEWFDIDSWKMYAGGFSDARKAMSKYKDRDPANAAEKMEEKAAAITLYTIAADSKTAPNQLQLDYMAKAAGEATAETLKNPDNNRSIPKGILAQRIQENIENRLEKDRAKIDAMGAPIAEIDANSGVAIFREIAQGVAEPIKENRKMKSAAGKEDPEGVYDQLAKAQQILSTEQKTAASKPDDKAQARADMPKIPKDAVAHSLKGGKHKDLPAGTEVQPLGGGAGGGEIYLG